MLKNVAKFFGMAVGIGILGVTTLFLTQYLNSGNNPEYQVMQKIKDLERKYAEDSYGGDTPEETLRLFIEALKAGNTELAAKYFILDKQEEWKEDLAKIKESGVLDDMIGDLEKTEKKISGDTTYFTLVRENDLSSQLIMHKNTANNKWKITEL